MHYLVCEHCGYENQVSHYLTFCKKCNKLLKNNPQSWLKKNEGKTMQDYYNLCLNKNNALPAINLQKLFFGNNKNKSLAIYLMVLVSLSLAFGVLHYFLSLSPVRILVLFNASIGIPLAYIIHKKGALRFYIHLRYFFILTLFAALLLHFSSYYISYRSFKSGLTLTEQKFVSSFGKYLEMRAISESLHKVTINTGSVKGVVKSTINASLNKQSEADPIASYIWWGIDFFLTLLFLNLHNLIVYSVQKETGVPYHIVLFFFHRKKENMNYNELTQEIKKFGIPNGNQQSKIVHSVNKYENMREKAKGEIVKKIFWQ